VIIIGGGASGLATAKRLLDLGIKPLILERENQLGGAGLHAGRFFAVETHWQEEQGIVDSSEFALNEWVHFSGGDPTSQHVIDFIEESADTLYWLAENGAVFQDVQSDIGAGSVARIHQLAPDSPPPLALWAEELRSYSSLSTNVLSIRHIDGVFQIYTEDEIWSSLFVVIASGGFARNIDIVEKSIPELVNFDWGMEAWPGMTGSSVTLMNELNIQLNDLSNMGLYSHSVVDPILGPPEVMIIPALNRSIILSRDGHRVFNEELTQSLYGGQLYLEYGPLYAIFDSQMWQGTSVQGMGYNYEHISPISATEYAELIDVTSANTIDDLAEAIGLNIHNFTQSLSNYNAGIQLGTDAFGKNIDAAQQIQSPPFYALPLIVTTAKSFGGATTHSNGRVAPYSNLYAVGEAAGFLGTNSLGWGFSGSITACYYSGKIVAEDLFLRLRPEER
jgi:fumarate reductase flavoprotein subunit